MTSCDMCGKEASLAKTRIEGTVLDLCQNCAKFGQVIARPEFLKKEKPKAEIRPLTRRKEVVQLIVEDYAEKIKRAREQLGLTQEEFAKKLNEKISILQKMEAGQFRPSIDNAKKFERMLRVRLVEEQEDGEVPLESKHKPSDGFTLGDFIKDKRKK